MKKLSHLLTNNKGQVEVALLIILGCLVLAGLVTAKKEKEKKAEEYIGALAKRYEQAYEKADFYGERLIFDSSPEEAFKLVIKKGTQYIIRYEEKGKEKVDSSVYSYASFDPISLNTLWIRLYNRSHIPIEVDYYSDRYYVQSYGGNIYQLEIDMTWSDYRKVINPQGGKEIWVKYPSSISKTDIKNIIIRLKTSNIIVGLQKIPR